MKIKLNVDRFDIEKIATLFEANEFEKCNQLAKKTCERLGHATPWLCWVRGVCEDVLGDPFEGLLLFKQALAGDPYNYNYLRAMGANLGIFQEKLLNALEQEDSLHYVQSVHKFLVEAGEFSSSHQYIVAKNYVKNEKYKEAREVLEGFLMNNPHDQEGLELEKLIDELSTMGMAS